MTRGPQNSFGINFVGSGSATPSQRIKNDELGLRVDTNDSWIKSRTGFSERRVIGKNETLTALRTKAAEMASRTTAEIFPIGGVVPLMEKNKFKIYKQSKRYTK